MKELIINEVFPLIEIPDNSFTVFLGLLCLGSISLSLALYFLYKNLIKNKTNTRERYLRILKNCDFINSKQSAYKISYYGKLLCSSIEEKNLLKELISELSHHKYKKVSAPISNELKEKLQSFILILEAKHV